MIHECWFIYIFSNYLHFLYRLSTELNIHIQYYTRMLIWFIHKSLEMIYTFYPDRQQNWIFTFNIIHECWFMHKSLEIICTFHPNCELLTKSIKMIRKSFSASERNLSVVTRIICDINLPVMWNVVRHTVLVTRSQIGMNGFRVKTKDGWCLSYVFGMS